MDGIGAAASILGIITAALQSTKYIYQVIAGIKDAPTVIKELGEKIGVLEDTLFRIKHIQRPLTLLKDRIEKCQRDLAGFTIRVEKMSDAFDGTSLSQKMRKGAQVWFKEDKFLAMNKTLDEYRQFFILEMNANTMETSEKSRESIDNLGNNIQAAFQGLEDSLIQKLGALIPALMQEKPKCQGGNSSGHCIEIDELEASIDQIMSLHAEKEKTVFSRTETRTIVKDFGRIIDFIEDTVLPPSQEDADGSSFTEDDFEDLSRLKGVMTSTRSIARDGISRIETPSDRTVIAAQSRHLQRNVSSGSFSVLHRKRKLLNGTDSHNDEAEDEYVTPNCIYMARRTTPSRKPIS